VVGDTNFLVDVNSICFVAGGFVGGRTVSEGSFVGVEGRVGVAVDGSVVVAVLAVGLAVVGVSVGVGIEE
jgi:hypothetical protein